MPRAGVHARRDAPLVRRALASLGLRPPGDLLPRLRERHRAIDTNQEDSDAELHFMRGPEVEDAPEALDEALGYGHARARRAVEAVRAGLLRRTQPPDAAIVALADALHLVRDSFSKGHAVREPGPGGPRVAALKSWGRQKQPHRAFGVLHLVHDGRFELPFRWFAPEVPASDRACAALLAIVAEAAAMPSMAWEARFEERWEGFVAAHFLPPGAPEPEEAEDQPQPPGRSWSKRSSQAW